MIYEVLALLFVLVFGYFLVGYFQALHKFRAFKGPHPLPIIGNFYNPKLFTYFRYLVNLRKEYGKTFVLHLFTKVYLVVLEPTIVRRGISLLTVFFLHFLLIFVCYYSSFGQ